MAAGHTATAKHVIGSRTQDRLAVGKAAMEQR
jgi:hypothetical protein